MRWLDWLVVLGTTYACTPANLSTNMSAAVGGDILQLAAGTYSAASFTVPHSGSAGNYIRIIGDPANPRNVVVNGGKKFNVSYVSVNGINFKGEMGLGGDGLICNFDSLAYCVVDSGAIGIRGVESSDTLATNSGNNVIAYCSFAVGNVGNWNALRLYNTHDNKLDHVRIFAARGYGLTGGDNTRARMLYYARRDTFVDTYLQMDFAENTPRTWHCNTDIPPVCDSVNTYEQTGTGIRDYSHYNVFIRDTLLINNTSHTLYHSILLSQSGSHSGTTFANQWYDCFYKVWGNSFEFQDTGGMNSCTIRGSVFASNLATALVFDANNSTIRNSTFFSNSNLGLRCTSANPSSTYLRNNVFVARPFTGCSGTADANGAALSAFTLASFGMAPDGSAYSDSNFFAPSTTDKVANNNSGATLCYTLAGWKASDNDPHSRAEAFSTSMFVDARWNTLDLHLTPKSRILGRYYPPAPDGHVADDPGGMPVIPKH